MLTKLAIQNIKGAKGYFLAYAITITFFFIIVYQVGNINFQLGRHLDSNGFIGVSSNDMFFYLKWIIYGIVIIFSAYIANFFIKRRSNEVALLKTLGLNRYSIFKMIFIENVFVILTSFLISFTFSLLTSRFVVFFSERLIGYRLDDSLSLSLVTSCILDVLSLAIIILIIISIIPLLTVIKTNIIQLFQDNKKSYELKKKPIFSLILFLIFTGLLIYMACFYISDKNHSIDITILLVYFLLAVLVAIFLYRGFLAYIFISFKHSQKGVNSSVRLLSFSHLAYRIPSLSKMMSLITIVTAILVILCISVFGVFNSFILNNGQQYGTTFTVVAKKSQPIHKLENEYQKIPNSSSLTIPFYRLHDSLITKYEDIQDDTINYTVDHDTGYVLMKYSDYQKFYLKIAYFLSDEEKTLKPYQQPILFSNIYYGEKHIVCSSKKELCKFLNQHNINTYDISLINNMGLTSIADTSYIVTKKTNKDIIKNIEGMKGLIGVDILVLNDDNPLFNTYDNKKEYVNVTSFPITKTYFTNLLEVNKLANSQQDQGLYSTTGLGSTQLILVFLLIGLFQTILLVGVMTLSIALIMSIFFRALENLENSLEEYIIAAQFGMSRRKILKAIIIEACVTQALPFAIGIVVSVGLFYQLYTSFNYGIPFHNIMSDSLTLFSLGTIAIILVILIVILVQNIYSRINFRNLKRIE
ncbi:MAG: hypothetical protein LBT75_02780 [Bacilli bacterium]|jgi:hypothetical protein|nr:hypothetical protein [Bacilli bacterium]